MRCPHSTHLKYHQTADCSAVTAADEPHPAFSLAAPGCNAGRVYPEIDVGEPSQRG